MPRRSPRCLARLAVATSAVLALSAPAAGSGSDWLTFGFDTRRTGGVAVEVGAGRDGSVRLYAPTAAG